MTQIATKFVKWDIPELATLQDSKVYKLRVHLNNGGKLNREEKNWITRNVGKHLFQTWNCLERLSFWFFRRSQTVFRQTARKHSRVLCDWQNSVTLDTVRQNRGYCRSKQLNNKDLGEYKFYQDRKVTSWERDYFSVKANSYEEAEAIVRSWNCEDVSNIIDNRLCYEEWQALTDTSESMLPEENDGNPTIEIFNEDGESIMTNVPKTPQSNQ